MFTSSEDFFGVASAPFIGTLNHGGFWLGSFIELDDGKIYRKALYLMVKTMVSCRFSLKPIH